MQVADQSLAIAPYGNEAINKIYNMLFCDNAGLYETGSIKTSYPHDVLLSSTPGTEKLNEIINDKDLDTRYKILAYHLLSKNGATINNKELLGVIIEVGLPEGLDVIAAYQDGTARYINYTGKLLVWDTQTDESNELVEQLFLHSDYVLRKIGPWDGERRPAPAEGNVRLSFLVSDGLYFGEGPFNVLEKDAMGGPVIRSAAELMNYLIDKLVPSK
ncbi:MAG: hypothetical protein QM737_14435 [Ferruginibacter sp.]